MIRVGLSTRQGGDRFGVPGWLRVAAGWEVGLSIVVIASQDQVLRASLSGPLLEAGYAVGFAASWQMVLEALSRGMTKVLVVDARMPGIRGKAVLLCDLASSLESAPKVFAVADDLEPLPRIARQPYVFRRTVSKLVGPAITKTDREHLKLLGLGARPMHTLARVARSSMPVCLEAERGLGKKQVAQALHLLGGGGPFVSFKATETPSMPSGYAENDASSGSLFRGTLYLPVLDEWPQERIVDTARWAGKLGWRFVLGTRIPPRNGLDEWVHLHLQPLRERPKDLHALTLYYIERHRRALGLPRRRFGRGLWALIKAYNWTGNARELESFVLAVLSSVDRYMIHPENLPPSVRQRVDLPPDAEARREAQDFESMVESQLRKVVSLYEPGGEKTLYLMVVEATERPLIKLALARSAGVQKDAARLLGINRNTLHSHMLKLGLHSSTGKD